MFDCFQIEDGEIHATIDQQHGMVQFRDCTERYDNPSALQKIDTEVRYNWLQIYYMIVGYNLLKTNSLMFAL